MIDRHWASLAVQRCIERGIDRFFLAPGSRCTPLTLAIADHATRVTQHFDERGLAFAALGYARATGKPGVFVCTSGTAVANAYPAVIEAAMEAIPMLLFTADRPPELRDTGANQTIDQQRIFGAYSQWFFDLPCPSESLSLDFLRSIVDRAVEESRQGPVHLNWMFREPFGLQAAPDTIQSVTRQVEGSTRFVPGSKLIVSGNTILAAGGNAPGDSRIIENLAAKHDLPLVADITSGIRCTSPDIANRLPAPDTIIHFGGRIVSKSWHQWTQTLKQTRLIHVTPRDIHVNPGHQELERYVESIAGIQLRFIGANTQPFNQAWQAAQAHYREVVESTFANPANGSLNEPAIAYEVAQHIPRGHGLFIGNSMPIRDFDRFAFWPTEKNITVGANRGASGIDGLIATGVGFAEGLDRATTVVLGDLSGLHDLNSLALLAKSKPPITLLIINNQAGGIFDMLPVASHTQHFEQFFATPHSLGFQAAADMFGLPYVCFPDAARATATDFGACYEETVQQGKTTIIEVKTDRQSNQAIRQHIQEQLRQ